MPKSVILLRDADISHSAAPEVRENGEIRPRRTPQERPLTIWTTTSTPELVADYDTGGGSCTVLAQAFNCSHCQSRLPLQVCEVPRPTDRRGSPAPTGAFIEAEVLPSVAI